jgi:hypothetical protein
MYSRSLLIPIIFLFTGVCFSEQSTAQDTLPNFKVQDIGNNRYVVSWTNNYPYTAQITIQRSFDSLRGYKSILTVPDPTSKQNGFADSKAVNDHMFYRLYILLDNGRYIFTDAKQPTKAPIEAVPPTPDPPQKNIVQNNTSITLAQANMKDSKKDSSSSKPNNTEAIPKEIKKQEEAITETTRPPLPVDQLKKVEPIIIRLENIRTGDSAKIPTVVTPQGEPNAYAPSLYVYTHPDGNIRIQVPNRSRLSRYRIRFYESDKSFLFELKNLPAPNFQLDKTNFLHGGWFQFELLEDNRIIEKHKLYLEKE